MRVVPAVILISLLLLCCSTQRQANDAAAAAERAKAQDQADDAECQPYAVPPAGSRAAYNHCRDMLKSSRPAQ